MRIVLLNFLSLDGVYQGPGSPDEDRTDGFERGGWLVPFVDGAFEKIVSEWAVSATGFLFGHRTYDEFASVWPTIEDPADQNARRLNTLPKYVAATSKVAASWGPVTVIEGDVMGHIAALKRTGEGELQVHGSGRLGQSLLSAGLADELRLAIAPVILGQGRKLFGSTHEAVKLSPLSQERTPAGLTMARFACSGAMSTGVYVRGETNIEAASR